MQIFSPQPSSSIRCFRTHRNGALTSRIRLGVRVLALSWCALGRVSGDDPQPSRGDMVPLCLPPRIYAVPGIETNVYFDNVALMLNPTAYVFDVECNRGSQQTERWTYLPGGKTIGQFGFKLRILDAANRVVGEAESMIQVAKADAGAGRAISLLMIGDSLTAASVYPQHVYDLCTTHGQLTVKMLGTVFRSAPPAGPYAHEGYGGWTAQRFATLWKDGVARNADKNTCGSPFLYADENGKPKLDFSRYYQDCNDGNAPDFVTILLGCNDTFGATDETIEERIDTMFEHYDTLLAMIHGASAKTQIGCLLLVPPAASQDAFGANYKCGQTRWQYKRNQFRVVQRMIEHYGGREQENVFLIPANVNLDCVGNYPSRDVPVNSRSELKVTRQSNGVHPAPEGYKQIGDSIYCWLKARLAAE